MCDVKHIEFTLSRRVVIGWGRVKGLGGFRKFKWGDMDLSREGEHDGLTPISLKLDFPMRIWTKNMFSKCEYWFSIV